MAQMADRKKISVRGEHSAARLMKQKISFPDFGSQYAPFLARLDVPEMKQILRRIAPVMLFGYSTQRGKCPAIRGDGPAVAAARHCERNTLPAGRHFPERHC